MAVRCRGLVKRYGDVTAVAGVDLDVARGETFGLLGPNGAGKTTTVEILEGLTTPDAGDVTILGRHWRRGASRDLRALLGVQLQETQLPDKLTVIEVIRLFASFYRTGPRPETVLAAVELEEKRHARLGKLSSGQRQRVALATALVGNPELIFLDEPSTGLDPQSRLKVWEIVQGFVRQGGTVFMTTHSMDEATQLCHRVAIMDHGKVIAEGTPAALVASLHAEQIVELRLHGFCDPPALEALPGVSRAVSHDGCHRLHVTDIGAALPALLQRLEECDARIESLTTHQATLEDVFVGLTGRGLRDV